VSTSRGGGLPVSPTGVLLGACVLVASAAAGFLAYRLSTPSHRTLYADTSPTLPPQGTGDASARKTPDVLPDIALPDLDGTTRRLVQWKGKPLLVNFWATWCEPCRREIPLLKTLRRERASEGLEVVGIAVDFRDVTGKYARNQGIDYPVLVGEQGGLEAVSAFGMDTVLPFSVFADSKGRILTLKIGELHRDEAVLILDRLAEVDAGKLSPAAARLQLSAALEKLKARRVADTGS
jgi:thiol-disulfide isomerase/thioredoxin